jgi:hypothetical protein
LSSKSKGYPSLCFAKKQFPQHKSDFISPISKRAVISSGRDDETGFLGLKTRDGCGWVQIQLSKTLKSKSPKLEAKAYLASPIRNTKLKAGIQKSP